MPFPFTPCFRSLFLHLLFVAALAGAPRAADWPQWRGPGRDAVTSETVSTDWPKEGPTILWRAQVGRGFACVVVTDGKAIATGHADGKDGVYCFDAASGEQRWAQYFPAETITNAHEGGPAATPLIHAGRVYTVSQVGAVLRCLDLDSGEVQWSRELWTELEGVEPKFWHGVSTSPLLADGKLIFDLGIVAAFDPATGEPLWRGTRRTITYASPVTLRHAGREFIVALSGDGLAIIDPADGREVAYTEWTNGARQHNATPIVRANEIFLSTGHNRGCTLLRFDGEKLVTVYENQTLRNHIATSVAWDGQLFGFDEAELVCMDWATGEERWRQGGFGKGTVLIANGNLIVLSEQGELAVGRASAEVFAPEATAQILGGKCWTQPTLAAGRLYARNAAGEVVCVKLGEP